MAATTSAIEYSSVKSIAGPLLIVEGVEGAAYGEIVEVICPDGEKRMGQVLEAREGLAVVQVF